MAKQNDGYEPSLPLATIHDDQAHREHDLFHHNHLQHQHHHNYHQILLQNRQATAIVEASTVTEVTTTISVVQQIDVDPNGSTFAVLTYLADATSSGSQAILTGTASLTATPSSASSGVVSSLSSAPSQTTSSLSASAALSLASSATNSTTLISSSSSLSRSFTNSSTLSSRSSLTYLTSSLSSSTLSPSISTFSSNAVTSTLQSISTGALGGAAGGTAVTSGTGASSTAASGNGTNTSSGSNVSTSAVVGGVVGSVAGVAFIALLLLLFVKWRKNRSGALLSLGSGRESAGDGADAGTREPPTQPSGGMAERRSFAYAVPAALASLAGYKRSSRQTDQTVSSTTGSERGFYRVSGRKLPSVLQTGGDGYGGGVPEDQTLSGSSFYRDSQGFYGGPGTPTFPPLETHRESGQVGTPVMRPSPARTPVTEQGPFGLPSPPLDDPLPPHPDILGRSHPSQDGSHASRFTEEV